MKKIRVGIIGQGRSGRDIHGVYLVKDERYQIVAVTDRIQDRCQRAVAEYKCEAHDDYRELLKRKDLDLVVNASFSHLHVPITLECLQAGHNVLCEKPLASKAADVDTLIAASAKAGKTLAIFQQSRYAPYFQQVRQVIGSGALGRIVQISVAFNGFGRRWDWQTLNEYNGGNLLNTGPHPLDQALVLFGDGMPKVTCFMDRTEGCFGDAENHVKLILSGEGHPLIDLEISSCCAYPCFTYNVYGTLGGMKAAMANAEWKYFKWDEAPQQQVTKVPLSKPDGTPAYASEQLTWSNETWPKAAGEAEKKTGYVPAAPSTNLTQEFYSMLYRTLAEGKPLEITPQQVRRQIAVIEECHRQNPQIHAGKK
ncbi:MAG: oxidoreductase [Lentisphaerae bacterium RIFOXYB12_FULL_65_16]|nr:MAG: oxidoreductase [Lentisphaerae bacterium RIFOXYA12_64_32]OGV85325.1 MAG: oxidoreductase [Lentisphaerae bacterium RIFOXYB12_FULL_65_16]